MLILKSPESPLPSLPSFTYSLFESLNFVTAGALLKATVLASINLGPYNSWKNKLIKQETVNEFIQEADNNGMYDRAEEICFDRNTPLEEISSEMLADTWDKFLMADAHSKQGPSA